MEIHKTHDGSSTLYSDLFNEHYHSRKEGALSESLYKHVKPALEFACRKKDNITVLDICFGLGYNTFATLFYLIKYKPDVKVKILTPEFDGKLVESLKVFEYPEEFGVIKKIIDEILANHHYDDGEYRVDLHIGKAEEYVRSIESNSIDIVYQDAFSPKKNPTLWSEDFFGELYRICNKEAMLTTYSSARVVKDNLSSAGFRVEKHLEEGFVKEGLKAFT